MVLGFQGQVEPQKIWLGRASSCDFLVGVLEKRLVCLRLGPCTYIRSRYVVESSAFNFSSSCGFRIWSLGNSVEGFGFRI